MDIPALEDIIRLSIVENERKLEATQYLDQVRVSSDRWNVGLKLFFDGKSEVAQFFGLSLVRDYMSNLSSVPVTDSIRECIRDAMKSWLTKVLSENISVPNYIINNVASIITLSIKNDYPELWPTAFTELLHLGGSHSFNGVEVVVRVMNDLEVEVVMFNEGRTKAEIAHNVIIKDTMRQTNTIKDIVVFLCTWASAAASAGRKDSADRTLLCLSEMIGWVDVFLVLNDALPTIYALFQDRRTRASATTCLLELAKKGMDPIAKVQMVHSIGLLPLLASIPPADMGSPEDQRQLGLLVDMVVTELVGCWAKFEDTVVFVGRGGGISSLGASPKGSSRKGGGGLSHSVSVVSMKSDGSAEGSMASAGSGGVPSGVSDSLLEVISTVSQLLRSAMTIMLAVFNHSDVAVSSTVFLSCNRVIGLLKTQSAAKDKIEFLYQNTAAPVTVVSAVTGAASPVALAQFLPRESYFMAADYLNALLTGIYAQMQWPEDFDFSVIVDSISAGNSSTSSANLDDDENDIVEAKKEVRKLFVNCCRVHPERCLELVGAVLSAQPQPISKAPFPPLEAALRLVHAFSECGPQNAKMVSEGSFPQLVRAIHGTDIACHGHPQVLLSYYEISLRYIKLVPPVTVSDIVLNLVGAHGLRCKSHRMIRNRSAYFLVKIAEAMEGKSSLLLSAIATPLSEILMINGRASLEALSLAISGASPSSRKDAGRLLLSEAAELHLFECIGLMTSSTYYSANGDGTSSEALVQQYQQTLLNEVTTFVMTQVAEVMAHRNQFAGRNQAVDQYAAFIAHKLNCLSCLAKGHSFKSHERNAQYFDAVTSTVVGVLESLPSVPLVRVKTIVFMHRMVNSLGPRSLLHVTQVLGPLLQHAELGDIEEAVVLLCQCMVEFQAGAVRLVGRYHGEVVERYKQLTVQFENSLLSNGGAMEAPHIEAERVSLQKQYLLYLQHVVTHSCHSVLSALEHLPLLEELLGTLLVSIQGGRRGGSGASISIQAGLPLRKGAIIVLVGLLKAWCPPSPTVSAEMANSAGFSSAASGSALNTHHMSMFRSFVFDHAVPAMLSSCSDGGRSVNVKDAAAQTVLVEIAALLWTLHLVLGSQDSVIYLSGVLTKLGWSSGVQQIFLQQLTSFPTLVAYRETFKIFMRSNS